MGVTQADRPRTGTVHACPHSQSDSSSYLPGVMPTLPTPHHCANSYGRVHLVYTPHVHTVFSHVLESLMEQPKQLLAARLTER